MKATETTAPRDATARSWPPYGGNGSGPRLSLVLLPLVVGGIVCWLGIDGGTYSFQSRTVVAIAIAWALVLGIGVAIWPASRLPRGAALAGALLAAYAAFTGLSVLWSASAERAFTEFNRATLYLLVFALVLVAARRGTAPRWAAGIAIGLTGIVLVGLTSRLFPAEFGQARALAETFPAAERRLSYPVNYWNALGTVAAFALPLLLAFAASARSAVLRGISLAPVPALAATVYLTSSRGASISAGIATVALFAFTSRRWATAGALALAGLGSALAVALLRDRHELVNEPVGSALAEAQGRSAAPLIVLICLVTGLLFAIATRFAPRGPRVPAAVKAALIAIALVALAVGIVAADPRQRFETFRQTPQNLEGSVEGHFFSTSGNGRWQLWSSATDQFETEPLHGQGAGSYEAWWAEHGTIKLFVRDAHSLFIEALAELGVLGLTLLSALFIVIGVVGVRRVVTAGDLDRPVAAALLALFLAFTFEASIDWMWEMTVVSLVAFACAALLTGPATLPGAEGGFAAARGQKKRAMLIGSAGAVVVALALLVAQAIPFLANTKIKQSQAAVAAERLNDALEDALAAREIQPWAASPRVQIALVYEIAGDAQAARAAIRTAIERDRRDWRLWLIAARIETKAGRFAEARASLERAIALNPRSGLWPPG